MLKHEERLTTVVPQDITCITPVFIDGEIAWWVASRAHHADIGEMCSRCLSSLPFAFFVLSADHSFLAGGILPGSMPPISKTLFDEGAQIVSFKVVDGGKYQHDELKRLLVEAPAAYEGSSGCRCFSDVESDVRAQISANNKGVKLISLLIEEYGLEKTVEYMGHVRDNAEFAVRNLLRQVARERGTKELHALDFLDDGTPIELNVTIDEEEGSAVFDFEGTGPEIYGNLNAPVSVTYSAISAFPFPLSLSFPDIDFSSFRTPPLSATPFISLLPPSDGKPGQHPSQPRRSRPHHRQAPLRVLSQSVSDRGRRRWERLHVAEGDGCRAESV